MKIEQCSETTAYKIQTLGLHPEESIQLPNLTTEYFLFMEKYSHLREYFSLFYSCYVIPCL